MNGATVTMSGPPIPAEVREFADQQGVGVYLKAVVDLARQAFPSSGLSVSLERDAEEEGHRYIALDVEAGSRTAEQLLAGQQVWSEGLSRICPSRYAVYFVLGWR